METFEQYSLINQQKWTDLLKGLEDGEHTFSFPSVADIKSCKSVAYTLNTDGIGRKYAFKVPDKNNKKVIITVKTL